MADITILKAVLSTTPARLTALMQAFPEDLLGQQPAPGEWSPIEVLHHLIHADRNFFPLRIKSLLAGEEFSPPVSQEPVETPPMELAAQFEALRLANLPLLDQVTAENLAHTATHSRMGLVSLKNLLNYWGGHDLMHLVQIEQALIQPFVPDSGPWHVNFAKHIPNSDAT